MADDKKTSTANSLLIIASLIIIAAGLKSAQALIVPFLLSVFIATIAATPLFWLRARGLKNNIALPTVIVGIITILAVLAGLLASSTSAFAAKLPFYQERLALLQAQLVAFLQQFDIPLDLTSVVTNLSPGSALTFASSTLAGIGAVLGDSLLITLTVVFILAEATSFPSKLRGAFNPAARPAAVCAIHHEHEPLYCHQDQCQHRHGDCRHHSALGTKSGLSTTVGFCWPCCELHPNDRLHYRCSTPSLIGNCTNWPCNCWRCRSKLFPNQYGDGQHCRTALYGTQPWAFNPSGISILSAVGLATRPRWYAAICTFDHDRQNSHGSQPRHGLDRLSFRAS